MSPDNAPITPVATIAKRVKELRGRCGWSAAQLGEAVSKHGIKWDRFTVANVESGKRQNVTVQELYALALALGVAPVNLLVPLEDEPYQLTPNRVEGADVARAWVRGESPLPGADEWMYFAEASLYDRRKWIEAYKERLDLGPYLEDEPLQAKIQREAERMRWQNKGIAEQERREQERRERRGNGQGESDG